MPSDSVRLGHPRVPLADGFGRLPGVCPTGALFRTEFGTVVVPDDVCNGCGTCVAGCPFGVVERRRDGTYTTPAQRPGAAVEKPVTGVAQKCTLCYDRLARCTENSGLRPDLSDHVDQVR